MDKINFSALKMEYQSLSKEQNRQLKSIILVSLGSFLLFFYIFTSSISQIYTGLTEQDEYLAQGQVFGSSTVAGESRLVDIKLNNRVVGEGIIEFQFPTKTSFAGAELYFKIDGNLEVKDVRCLPGFSCVYVQNEDNLKVVILRSPEYADIPLIGLVQVATVVYDKDTFGEVILNNSLENSSKLVEIGNDTNILVKEIKYLYVGNYSVE